MYTQISCVSYEQIFDKMHVNGDRMYRVESQFYEIAELTDDWGTALWLRLGNTQAFS